MENKDQIHTPETAIQEHDVRMSKVQELQKKGLSAWPAYKPVSTTIMQALKEFDSHKDGSASFSLAGRIVALRDHGKTFFGHIQDRTGKIQIYLKKDDVGESQFEHFKHFIDIGDIIWISGSLFVTKTGATTLKVKQFELLSKCLHPLPEKFHGLADVEQRYRQRYLDLISNPESREKFQKRSGIVQAIREFLYNKDFMEVETPMLHPIPGGATARPFVTHHNAYNMDLYLKIAPELYLKQLVVGGFERVFEINRSFRNEGVSTKHNPEFTTLEFYMAYGDYKIGMELTEQLIQHTILKNYPTTKLMFQGKEIDFAAPFKRLTLEESLITIGGLTKDQLSKNNINATIKQLGIEVPGGAEYGTKLFAIFDEIVEEKIIQPTFIIGYPLEVSPLAKKDTEDPTIAARAELFVHGMEIANLYTELNDPIDQAYRFELQVKAREAGDDEAQYYDADYVRALEYGLPPTVGCGIGIDRLTMLLTDTTSIKDVILFPTLKHVKE